MGIGECDKQYNYVYENWSQLLLFLFIFVGKVWQNNDLWRLMSHVSRKKQGIRSFWFSQKNFGFSDYKPFTYPSTNSIFVFFIVLLNLKSLKATLPPTLWGIVFTFKNEKKKKKISGLCSFCFVEQSYCEQNVFPAWLNRLGHTYCVCKYLNI